MRTTRPPSPAVKATPTPWIDHSIAFQSVSTPLVEPGWTQPPWRLPASAPVAHPWLPWAARTSTPAARPSTATPAIAPTPPTIPALSGERRARRRKAPGRLTSGSEPGAGGGGDAGGGGAGTAPA